MATHLRRTAPAGVELQVTWRNRPPAGPVVAHRVDLCDGVAVEALLAAVRPAVVVHTAYSIDRRDDVVEATQQVASACGRHGAELVHLSSDVVFSGESPPYSEGSPLAPVNDYGRWKAEAEARVIATLPDACITRTSLVVSLDPPDRGTAWLLDGVRAGERPTLFHDEIRSAVRAEDLARSIWALLGLGAAERSGVWHIPGPEPISRVELGRRVLRAAGLDPLVAVAGSVRDHPTPRARDTTLVSHRNLPGPRPRRVP